MRVWPGGLRGSGRWLGDLSLEEPVGGGREASEAEGETGASLGVLEIVSQSCAWSAYLRGEDRLGVLGWRGDRQEKEREIRGFRLSLVGSIRPRRCIGGKGTPQASDLLRGWGR